ERPPLPGTAPGSLKGHTTDVEEAVESDTGTRTRRVGRRCEHAVLHEDATRAAVSRREVVTVHADRCRLCRETALHRRDRLPQDDRRVREHRLEAVETDRTWSADDVDGDGAVRRELHAVLIRRSREQGDGLREGGRRGETCAGEGDERDDESEAAHGS